MIATLIKPLKSGTKTITGEVIQRGLGTITLAVINKNGGKDIKRFKESNFTVVCK